MDNNTSNTETFTCDTDSRFGKTARTWHGTEGTVVYLDGMNRWNRETSDLDRTFRTAREAFTGTFEPVPELVTVNRFAYPSYTAYCAAKGITPN